MKTLAFIILFLTGLLLPGSLYSQTGDYFSLKEIIQDNTANSSVNPSTVHANSRGGFLEVEVSYYGNCIEKYRYEFEFEQDMTSLQADKSYRFSYTVELMSSQCNTNRNASIRPGASLGATSGLVAGSGYGDIVNAIGVQGGEATYAKDLGKPNVYKTGKMEGEFIPKSHKLNAYSWFNFVMEAPSNLNGEHFYFEILYLYQITNKKSEQSFSCPPPDCSGFPGTVRVWNFETNQGECWCPEGSRWNKMVNKCEIIKK